MPELLFSEYANLMDRTDKGIIILTWLVVVLPVIIVFSIRVWVIVHGSERNNFIGDILAGIAFIFIIIFAVQITMLAILGVIRGSHNLSSFEDVHSSMGLRLAYFCTMVYYSALFIIKGAIVAIFYTIIPESRKKHRLALRVVTVYVGVAWLLVFCINIFACYPIPRNWARNSTNCYAYGIPWVMGLSAAMNISCDLAIIALPFPLLGHLQVSLKTKFGLAAIFSMGIVSIIATVMRLLFVLKPALASNHTAQSYLWCGIEQMLSFIIACFPAMRTLFFRPIGRNIDSTIASFTNGGVDTITNLSKAQQRLTNNSDMKMPGVYSINDGVGTVTNQILAPEMPPGMTGFKAYFSPRMSQMPRRVSSSSESSDEIMNEKAGVIVRTELEYKLENERGETLESATFIGMAR